MDSNENSSLELAFLQLDKPSHRVFSMAVGLSLLVHLFALALIPMGGSESAQPLRRIHVDLVAQVSDSKDSAAPEIRSDEQAEEFAAKQEIVHQVQPSNMATTSPAPSAIPLDAVASGNPVDSRTAIAELPMVASRPIQTGPETVIAVAEAASGDSESNWEESIRLDLLSWLEQHKRYPMAARRNGVEGSVLVRFVLDADGRLLEKELLQSSGSRHLDSAAMKLLTRAAPYPDLPERLLAETLEVRLPIEYRLVVGRHRT
jgi:TonB family protein